jgi:hypothetical protein
MNEKEFKGSFEEFLGENKAKEYRTMIQDHLMEDAKDQQIYKKA